PPLCERFSRVAGDAACALTEAAEAAAGVSAREQVDDRDVALACLAQLLADRWVPAQATWSLVKSLEAPAVVPDQQPVFFQLGDRLGCRLPRADEAVAEDEFEK